MISCIVHLARSAARTSRYTFSVHPCLSTVNLHVADRHWSAVLELRERLSQLAFSAYATSARSWEESNQHREMERGGRPRRTFDLPLMQIAETGGRAHRLAFLRLPARDLGLRASYSKRWGGVRVADGEKRGMRGGALCAPPSPSLTGTTLRGRRIPRARMRRRRTGRAWRTSRRTHCSPPSTLA